MFVSQHFLKKKTFFKSPRVSVGICFGALSFAGPFAPAAHRVFLGISREMDGKALASDTKVQSVVINKEGSLFFFQPIAFAVICTLWRSPLPSHHYFRHFFLNHSWFLTFIITCQQDLRILQLHAAKKSNRVCHAACRRGQKHTWNEGGLWGETPLMLLGCFPSRIWPILSGI